ncbi:BTB/POZ domain-containing protein 3-like [Oculina patagonica]
MVNNSLLSDVTFIVHDNRSDKEITVFAHKYVLSIGSPVFFAMFYGAMATDGAQRIRLPDCDAESLKEFLSFLYCDEVCISEENAVQLLYLAKKYMVSALHEKTQEKLRSMINVANVFEMLPSILQLDEEELAERCWKIVDFDTEQAINSEAFCEIDRDVLEQVLERDELTIREVDLFRRVLDWAKTQEIQQESDNRETNIRDVLGKKVIHLMRFPTMSFIEFNGLVSSSGVLTENEVNTLTHFYHGFRQEPPRGFSERFPRGQMFRCNRFSWVSPPQAAEISVGKSLRAMNWKWNYVTGSVDSVTFSVQVPIIICGIRLFGNKDASHYVKLSIFHESRSTSLPFTTEGTFQSEEDLTDGYYGFDVPVYPPFYLKNSCNVTIQVAMKGLESYFGVGGNLSLDCEGVRFHFLNKRSPNGTTATNGQFAEILFKTDL